MAAVRTMMSVVREEAAVVSAEAAAAAKTSLAGAVRTAEAELNPSVIRGVVQAGMKEGALGEHSLVTSNLAKGPLCHTLNPSSLIAESLPAPNNILAESQSIIGKAIERESGFASFREALSNATQTGAEEQLEDMVDTAKALLKNPEVGAQVQAAM